MYKHCGNVTGARYGATDRNRNSTRHWSVTPAVSPAIAHRECPAVGNRRSVGTGSLLCPAKIFCDWRDAFHHRFPRSNDQCRSLPVDRNDVWFGAGAERNSNRFGVNHETSLGWIYLPVQLQDRQSACRGASVAVVLAACCRRPANTIPAPYQSAVGSRCGASHHGFCRPALEWL